MNVSDLPISSNLSSRSLIAALITGAVIFSAVKPVLGHSSANLKYSCHKQKFSHFPHSFQISISA